MPSASACSGPLRPARMELLNKRPVRVSFQGMWGSVLAVSGPWRTSGDWWREDAWKQEEWDLEIIFEPPPPILVKSGPAATHEACTQQRGAYCFFFDSIQQKLVCAGNLRLMYIELHARSAFSFLEGASVPEELAGTLRRARNARHGPARSRRRVRLAALLSGRQKNFHSGAHRRGNHFRGRLALSRCSSNPARATRIFAA